MNKLKCFKMNPSKLSNIGDEYLYDERKSHIAHFNIGDKVLVQMLKTTPSGKKSVPEVMLEDRLCEVYNPVHEYTPTERKGRWTPTSNCPWGNVGLRRIG
jgi:hypothetical protein